MTRQSDEARLAADDEIITAIDRDIATIVPALLPELGFKRGHRDIRFFSEAWATGPGRQRQRVEITREMKQEALATLPAGSTRVLRSVWQKPITERSRIVGFVDLAVEIEVTTAACTFREKGAGGGPDDLIARLRGEAPAPQETLVLQHAWEVGAFPTWLGFKVAPAIRSISELIRKVRTLESHTSETMFVVASPDDRYAEQLRKQQIAFLKVPVTPALAIG